MIVIDHNGQVWFDSPAVQAAVWAFKGEHCGLGDFAAFVPDEDGASQEIFMARYDGTELGQAIVERHGFTGRPHLVSGPTVSLLVQALVESGQHLVEEGAQE